MGYKYGGFANCTLYKQLLCFPFIEALLLHQIQSVLYSINTMKAELKVSLYMWERLFNSV